MLGNIDQYIICIYGSFPRIIINVPQISYHNTSTYYPHILPHFKEIFNPLTIFAESFILDFRLDSEFTWRKTIFTESSILDIQLGSEFASDWVCSPCLVPTQNKCSAQGSNFIKKRLQHGCFPVNITIFSRIDFQ